MTVRHRLQHGGNGLPNAALSQMVVVRMRSHQPTFDYVWPRIAEGRSKSKVIQCLEHFVARKAFGYLRRSPSPPHPAPSAACACSACSGAPRHLGEDVTEVLN